MTRTPRRVFFSISLLLSSLALTCHGSPARLIMFSSPTCGPCQQMKPLLRQLSQAGYQVQLVDVTQRPDLADRHRVRVWPTFIVLVDDQVHARAHGLRSLRHLEVMMQSAVTRAARQDGRPTPDAASPLAEIDFADNFPGAPAPPSQPQTGRIVDLEQAGMNPPRRAAASDALLAATVRISVADQEGHSRGTGTIVDARRGEALILTCGHIFRESQGRGPITVTLFAAGPQGAVKQTETTGTLIDYDLDRDLGLISIRPDVPVHAVQIAPSDDSQPGSPVTTVGCNRGADPTVIPTRITALNRYEGYANIEAAGAPTEGRSGGGLFNAAGQLIGVCFAADPAGDEGLYVALDSIHAKLNQQQLTMVYRRSPTPSGVPEATPGKPWPDPVLPQLDATAAGHRPSTVRGQEPTTAPATQTQQPFPTREPPAASTPPTMPEAQPPLVATSPGVAAASRAPSAPQLSPLEQATLEELRRRGVDSEVICIIRPRTPEGRSEVINLSKVSPAFVEALVGGAATATTDRP